MNARLPWLTLAVFAVTSLVTGAMLVRPEIGTALQRDPLMLEGEWWRFVTTWLVLTAASAVPSIWARSPRPLQSSTVKTVTDVTAASAAASTAPTFMVAISRSSQLSSTPELDIEAEEDISDDTSGDSSEDADETADETSDETDETAEEISDETEETADESSDDTDEMALDRSGALTLTSVLALTLTS